MPLSVRFAKFKRRGQPQSAFLVASALCGHATGQTAFATVHSSPSPFAAEREVNVQPNHSLSVCLQPPQPSDGLCQGHRADGAAFKSRTEPSENWSEGVGKLYMVLLFLEFRM